MGWLFFLGGFVFLAIIAAFGYFRLRRWLKLGFGSADLKKVVSEAAEDTVPRSLSGGDSIYLPMILRDFPDFNVDTVKTMVRAEVEKYLTGKDSVKIHRVAIRDYKNLPNEKVIVFQASAGYRVDGRWTQHRYTLQYSWLMKDTGGAELALNCPSCGAPIRDASVPNCPYCGCRVLNVTGNSWVFTDIFED